jgi:5-methylcytosine-specific restriction endonuclease McrA
MAYRRAHDPAFRARQRAYGIAFAEANPDAVFARKKAWRDANAEHVRERERAWRAANKPEMLARKYRDRRIAADLPDDVAELVDPAVVFERDRGVCQLCGEPVDPELRMPDPMCATVDHVIPVVDPRSTHAYANVQLAHWDCNRRKNRTVPDDAELVGGSR